jgi:MerR family redox-sensitive transcriptional activator SoxR
MPSDMPIGEVARAAGVAPSAIRYYEKAGLLPKPGRQSGQRRYGAQTAARLKIIQLARDAGFTIAETRTFLSGFSPATTPAARWRALAARKLTELASLSERIARMKTLLDSSFHCGCLRIEDCERAIAASCCAPAADRADRAGRAGGAGRGGGPAAAGPRSRPFRDSEPNG